MAAKNSVQPLRILCLHGFRQSSAAFKGRSAAFRRALKRVATFEFAQAPYRLDRLERQDNKTNSDSQPEAVHAAALPKDTQKQEDQPLQQFTWWKMDDSSPAHLKYVGWREAIASLEQTVKEKGPFDGILGFSQGASITALVCALQQQSIGAAHTTPDTSPREMTYKWAAPPFKFAFLIGGFIPRDPELSVLFSPGLIDIPSLHLWGSADTLVVPERSKALCSMFAKPTSVVHDGGHYYPSNAQYKDQYVSFLSQFLSDSQSPSSAPASEVPKASTPVADEKQE